MYDQQKMAKKMHFYNQTKPEYEEILF